jgi:hypothetical protein
MAWGTENEVMHQYFDDIKQRTLELGYSSIKEATIDLYEKLGGARQVGQLLGLCGSTVNRHLKCYKYPNIKGRGGPNNPTGIKYVNHKPKGLQNDQG